MRAFTLTLVGFVLLSGCDSQNPPVGGSCSMDSSSTFREEPDLANRPVPLRTRMAGNGHAETWDGRVFVAARHQDVAPHRLGWLVSVFRPENLRLKNGAPDFGDADSFSPLFALELEDTPDTGMTGHNALGLAQDPNVAENPFRSDRSGNPRRDGRFETYALVIYTQYYADGDQWVGTRPARIVVRDPKTPSAAVERAEMLGPFGELHTVKGDRVHGIEPTVTADGKLLVYQGHSANDNRIGYMIYSYNENPSNPDGWSVPRSMVDMYYLEGGTKINGVPFHQLYPIANKPWKDATGRVFKQGELYVGAYPWISHDGTELFHTALVAGCTQELCPNYPPHRWTERARRGGEAVIGRWTGYQTRLIDGPINPDRLSLHPEPSLRLFMSSPGAIPTMWRPYPESRNLVIPYTGGRPMYPIFGSNSNDYSEVSFDAHEDGHYALALDMNEMVTYVTGNDPDSVVDPSRTPDTSGNQNHGQLQGAKFPQEFDGRDQNIGAEGQAVLFTDSASVLVKNSPTLNDFKGGLTVELWANRMVDLSQGPENRFRFLIEKPGVFNLILEEGGEVQGTVFVIDPSTHKPIERRSGPTRSIGLNRWSHVAMNYRPASGRLRVFIDGRLEREVVSGAADLDSKTADLLIGPAGKAAPAWPDPSAALVSIDQVRISNISRSEREIGLSAHVTPSRDWDSPTIGLPLGLRSEDLRVPRNNPLNAKAARLGELLFGDTRLSRGNNMSCATCHQPGLAFTDGLKTSTGNGGKSLRRNAPTLFNRAFSTGQFWDGRSGTLEDQALIPIANPEEMNLSIDEAIQRLNDDPEYPARFRDAFGSDPSPATLAMALSSFQRTLFAGDSRADRFEAGDIGALSDGEIRGRTLFRNKARCVACHLGSNFSDEGFHATAVACTTDLGRKEATSRARDLRAFKTPTLRDVDRTAPFFHDGSAATLEAVVDFYDKGGNFLENRDSEIRPLGLQPDEKADLVSYLRALTSP